MAMGNERRFSLAVEAASRLARDELLSFAERVDGMDPVQARDALKAIVPAIVEKYGNMAAAAAADYYERERAEAVGGSYHATLAAPVDAEAVKASVGFACGYLFEGESE